MPPRCLPRTGHCALPSSVTSSGSSSSASTGCRSTARSSGKRSRGRRRPEEGVLPVRLARLAGAARSSRLWGVTTGGRELPSSSGSASAWKRAFSEPQRRGFSSWTPGRADDHDHRREDVPEPERTRFHGTSSQADAVYSGAATRRPCGRHGRRACSWRRRAPFRCSGGRGRARRARASARDPGERYERGDLDRSPGSWPPRRPGPRARTVGDGGLPRRLVPAGAAGRPPVADAYGAGDSFAAGLTYALARGSHDGRGARRCRARGGRGHAPPRRSRRLRRARATGTTSETPPRLEPSRGTSPAYQAVGCQPLGAAPVGDLTVPRGARR